MENYNPKAIEGVIEVASGLYVKTPESLSALVRHLTAVGYDVKDVSSGKALGEEKPPRSVQEKEGWSLWYASLSDRVYQFKGKCGSCKGDIRPGSIGRPHGEKCGHCGDTVFLKFVPGSRVKFRFNGDQQSFNDLTLIVHSYDAGNKELRFFKRLEDALKPDGVPNNVKRSYERLPQQLRLFGHRAFTEKAIDGVPVLATHYDVSSIYVDGKEKISIYDIWGERRNFSQVKVFNGKEYGQWDKLPIPESHSIYEAWHWMPLQPSPKLHERILSAAGQAADCGHYYQDGRPAFWDQQLGWMRTFVEHFTTLDINKWEKMVSRAPKDGPGFIKTIAKFCHPKAIVENKPNMGNALVAMGKMLQGEPVTPEEAEAGERGLREDPHGQDFFNAVNREKDIREDYEDLDRRRN